MKLVFAYPFILAFVQYVSAVTVCNMEVPSSSTLTTKCKGNDVTVLWPNYNNPATYYRCVDNEKSVLEYCPQNTYFVYYQQTCVDCRSYIPPPTCETLREIADVTCVKNINNNTTTKAPPSTTKAPLTTKSPQPTKVPTSTKTPPTVPTPPSQSSTLIPMPPIIVTPQVGIPTPPSENLTPPSIPGTPPMLTTVPADLFN